MRPHDDYRERLSAVFAFRVSLTLKLVSERDGYCDVWFSEVGQAATAASNCP